MKKIIAIVLVLTALLSLGINSAADNSVYVLVNTEIEFEVDGEKFVPRETDGARVYPLSFNDRTYIPARFIAEKIGMEVTWDEATQTVGFITKNNAQNTNASEVEENIPQKFNDYAVINQDIRFEFDGEEFIPKETDGSRVYPLSYKDRTYIPARFIAEKAGVTVTWDEATQTVGFNTSTMPNTVVAKIGNQEIYAYEIMSLMRLGATKEEALENMNMMKVFALKAEEYGLSMSDEEIASVREQIMQQKEQDAEYFDIMLDAYGITEERFIQISLLQQLQSVVGQKIGENGLLPLPTDDEILQYYNDNFLMSEHILFSTVDENRQPIDDVALIDEKAMKANEVSEKIKNGASFDEFISLTEEPVRDEDGMLFLNTANFDADDPALSYFPQIGIAIMVTEFEEGTAALEISEVSEPVKSDFGFHIIRRLALPTEGEEFEQTKQSISMVLDNINYTKLVEGWAAEYEKSIEEKYFNALTVTPYTEDEDVMNRLQSWQEVTEQE